VASASAAVDVTVDMQAVLFDVLHGVYDHSEDALAALMPSIDRYVALRVAELAVTP
jgi:hypothetical protein